MREVQLRAIGAPPPGALPVEIVEQKGLGHPDSICDSLAEELSLALTREYAGRFGAVLHHNVDKALLVGGRAAPEFGGGEVLEPIEIFLAGRATSAMGGETVDVEELAMATATAWLGANLRALDPRRHVKLHCLVRPGSAELVDLFAQAQMGGAVLANDTSCGVGFAPLSELERAVYETGRGLNAAAFRSLHPAVGEDTKIMGVRRGAAIHLTVACAMIGKHLATPSDYLALKEQVAAAACETARRYAACEVTAVVNAADAPERNEYYVTVTGTSAESGDDGEAGRGNRANGLITPYRPMTMESVAGKNPVSHVGKLYNLAAGIVAQRIVEEIPEVTGAECILVSEIGRPIQDPRLIDIGIYAATERVGRLTPRVARIAAEVLDGLDSMWRSLIAGKIGVGRWPFSVQ